MNIWRFYHETPGRYASAVRDNMWSEFQANSSGKLEPLIMEWEPGSDIIGDFTWPALAKDIVATEAVGKSLIDRFLGIRLEPIEMVQRTSEKILQRERKSGIKRILLPYTGPQLAHIFVNISVPFNKEGSSVSIRTDRYTGNKKYKLEGVEEISSTYNRDTKRRDYFRVPRELDKGIYLNNDVLSGHHIFRIHGFEACIFCTNSVKTFIEKKKYTNVTFLDYGNVE